MSAASRDWLAEVGSKLDRELLHIEQRTDMTREQKAQRVIVVTASLCAGVAVQPIPVADILFLTPIQIAMAIKLSQIRGFPVSREKAKVVLGELAGMLGLGLLAQHSAITLYKLGLPLLGGCMTIPLVFGLTYGIGRAADYYFQQRAAGRPVDREAMRRIWKEARRESKSVQKMEGSRSERQRTRR
jgi:uncharacterized protein (DUF697 family)